MEGGYLQAPVRATIVDAKALILSHGLEIDGVQSGQEVSVEMALYIASKQHIDPWEVFTAACNVYEGRKKLHHRSSVELETNIILDDCLLLLTPRDIRLKVVKFDPGNH